MDIKRLCVCSSILSFLQGDLSHAMHYDSAHVALPTSCVYLYCYRYQCIILSAHILQKKNSQWFNKLQYAIGDTRGPACLLICWCTSNPKPETSNKQFSLTRFLFHTVIFPSLCLVPDSCEIPNISRFFQIFQTSGHPVIIAVVVLGYLFQNLAVT